MLTQAQLKQEYWLRKLLPRFGVRLNSAQYNRKDRIQAVEADFGQILIRPDGQFCAWRRGAKPTPYMARTTDLKPILAKWGCDSFNR